MRWFHGRSYDYTLTYNANGSGRIVVRDDGKVLIDQTYNKPRRRCTTATHCSYLSNRQQL